LQSKLGVLTAEVYRFGIIYRYMPEKIEVFNGWSKLSPVTSGRSVTALETVVYFSDFNISSGEGFNKLPQLYGDKYENEVRPLVAGLIETVPVEKKLASVLEKPPTLFIDLGDHTTSDELRTLQRMYYELAFNNIRSQFKKNPDIKDEELLAYPVKLPNGNMISLGTGLFHLGTYERFLGGKTLEQIEQEMGNLNLAERARWINTRFHYGHYVSNLDREVKRTLVSGVEGNARRLLGIYQEGLIAQGVNVKILGGNWDMRIPPDFQEGIDAPDPLPEGWLPPPLPEHERPFVARLFFNEHGIQMLNSVALLWTQSGLHILFPFDGLMNMDKMEKADKETIRKAATLAYFRKQQVVIAAHGMPDLDRHNLQPFGEHPQTVKGARELIALTKPHYFIYGHVIKPMLTEDGKPVDSDMVYRMRVGKDGVAVVRSQDFREGDTTVVYLPYGGVAKLTSHESPEGIVSNVTRIENRHASESKEPEKS